MNELQILEKLINMLGNAGEGAYTLIVLFIVKDYFLIAAFFSTAIFVVIKVVELIKENAIKESFLDELAELIGTTQPLDKRDKERIKNILKEEDK
jgi:hypothetical protein